MNRESLDKICERGILGLVLAILIYTPLAFGGRAQIPMGSSLDLILVNPFAVVQGIIPVILVLWGIRLWINPRAQLLWPPVCWAVLAFAVYALIRYLTADIEYVARLEMIQVLVYTFLFFIIVNNLHRQDSVQMVVLSLIFLAMVISIYAIYQFTTGSDRVWNLLKPYTHRGTGTFISPNNLGGFLEMILPLGLAFTLTSRLKPLTKVFTGYASLVILVGIIVTLSRGSWVATGASLAIFFMILMLYRAHRLPALVLLIAIVAAGIHFAPRNFYLQSRITQMQSPEGRLNDDGRFEIWQAALQLWHENIWWGIGPGHFNYRFGKYRPEIVQVSPDRVHNDYLNTLTDWGVVGTAIIAVALALVYAGAFRIGWSLRGSANTLGEQGSSKRALVLGAAVGLGAILIHSAVDFNMHIPANAILVVTLMAFLTAYLRFVSNRYWLKARPGIKIPLTLALAAGAAYFGWQTIRSCGESYWLIQAQKAAAASPQQIASLEKAFSIEPKNADTARAIGEAFRLRSWQGVEGDYQEPALEAMKWFTRAVGLNPFDDSSVLRCGMCLDQIGRHDEALACFQRAVALDPNSYFDDAYMGWHYVQTGDYAAARPWLLRSHRLEWNDNPVADSYLRIVNDQMSEAATNTSPFRLP